MISATGEPLKVTLGELQQADGSAEYACNGYSVISAVNGPIEVQRRDELPEEAVIDVIVRPVAGVGSKSYSNLALLPVLLQASVFALLSASIPLSMTLSTTCIAIGGEGAIMEEPTYQMIQQAKSVHVFAFSTQGNLLLAESEGDFSFQEWEQVHNVAEMMCRGPVDRDRESEDVEMDNDGSHTVESRMRDVLQHKMAMDQRWKENII